MGDAALEEELDTVRGELEELQVKFDGLLDEQDRKMAEMEADFEEKMLKLEKDSKDELEEVQADCDQKIDDLTAQLDKLRRAMTGDACGWSEKRDGSGDLVYENSESGETSYEKPEVLVFAQTIQKIESAADDKAKIAKLEQKTKDADAKKRESDVKFNESRAETSNLRGLNKGWKDAAEVVFFSLTAFDETVAKITSALGERSEYIGEKRETLVQLRKGVEVVTAKVAETQGVLYQREQEVRRLTSAGERLARQLRRSEAECESLRESVAVQIERVAAPLRDELAMSYTLLMEEKAAREGDRQAISDLWPEGWLLPSILQKYKTLSPEERDVKRAAAEAADAENRLKMDIREAVAEAAQWSAGYDDYGRAFYANAKTGEQVSEPPAAMSYRPPPGRDEMGNRITDPAARAAAAEAPRPKKNPSSPPAKAASTAGGSGGSDGGSGGGQWEEVEDEWGQPFYRHSETGEESWERPEGMDGGEGAVEVAFAEDMNPRDRAIHSARCVIEWLRASGYRETKKQEDDDDYVPPVEGEPVDDEAKLYDMDSVAELAKGDDGWTYEPVEPEDSDSDSDSDDEEDEEDEDDDEGEGGEEKPVKEKKEKKGPPPVAAIRLELYEAAVEEEAMEQSLRHCRRKVERLSKHLIDRIHEVEKEEKEAVLPKDTQMDGEGQSAVASALAELEASMAAASASFTITPDGAKDESLESLQEAHDQKPPLAPVDGDTLWAELAHRRLVDAAMPRGPAADDLAFDLSAEALWAGLSGQPLQAPHAKHLGADSDEEWRTRAFFARAAEADDSAALKDGGDGDRDNDGFPKPIAVTVLAHERHRRAAADAAAALDAARRSALSEAGVAATEQLAMGARDAAAEANFTGAHNGTLVGSGTQGGGGGWGRGLEAGVVMGDGRVAMSDSDPARYVAPVPHEDPFPDDKADALRLERQSAKRAGMVADILTQDEIDLYGAPRKHHHHSRRLHAAKAAPYQPPVPRIVQEAELHAAALAPLLDEADALRVALWDAHELESEKLQGASDELRSKQKALNEAAAGNHERQVKVAAVLRGLLVARTAPKAPRPVSMEGKTVALGHMPTMEEAADPEGDFGLELEDESLDALLVALEKGGHDGTVVELPPGRHATEAQTADLEAAVEARNVTSLNKEKRRFDFENKRFERRRAEFEAAEVVRGQQLTQARRDMKLIDTDESAIAAARGVIGRWAAWVDHELKLAAVRADGMYTSEMRAASVRAKQVVEQVRGAEAVARLQDELSAALGDRRRVARLPDGARNAIERIALEREKAAGLTRLRLDVLRLREALVEEGRRRRMLYDEEAATAQAELRRVRELEGLGAERATGSGLVGGLFGQVLDSTEAVAAAKRAEVEAAKEPIHAFSSAAFSQGVERLGTEERCLEALLLVRRAAQDRERRAVSEHAGLLTVQLPPAPDQWLPRSERARLTEEMWSLRSRLDSCVREAGERIVTHVQRRQDAEKGIGQLRAQASAQNGAAVAAVSSMRVTAGHSVEMLKHMIDTQRDELTAEVQRYQRALGELAREYSMVKHALTAKVEHLELRVEDLTSWLKACRYDLSVETAKRLIGDAERKRIIFAWRKQSGALRAELVGERMHCARMELWVGAMRKDVTNYTKEIWLREKMLELQKLTNDGETRRLKQSLWKNATGLSQLSTDVDALFLFFAQRVANLAGSRRHYNEALRANGAALVLAALCRGPRMDLRRLGARALGQMGWDGYVEQRLLGWDARRSWELWLEQVVPKEERRLQRLGLTFSDPCPTAGDAAEKFEAPPGVTLRALIVARRQWALRNARRKEGPNLANMRLLGSHPDVLRVLVMLTHEADIDTVRSATLALCVAAFHEHNNGAMGRLPECVATMVRLCATGDQEVSAQAAATLANLGYGHELNQRLIGESGGVEQLLDLCCSDDVDVIESGSAALANLICLHKGNAVKAAASGGIQVLLRLLSTSRATNLLDSDQLSEIHANAAEALANLTSNYGEENSAAVHALGVAPLVLLCGSGNLQVRRHAALVLGNVSQSDEHRAAIGLRGGVEALFLLCEADDEMTLANALWALGNLAWHPHNQDRIGRFFKQLSALCRSKWLPVRTNAAVCLANALFYHDKNRGRLEAVGGAVAGIVDLCRGTADPLLDVTEVVPLPLQEASLRALVSLSYTDRLCLALGTPAELGGFGAIPVLLANAQRGDQAAVQRFSLMALLNLCTHDENKRRILDGGGVETLVFTAGSDDAEVVVLGREVLTLLADLKAVDELAVKRSAFGIRGMLDFLTSGTASASTRRLAVESLAEQLWMEPAKQAELCACGGIEVLFGLVSTWRAEEEKVLLPALWALRNAMHENEGHQSLVGDMGGVDLLLEVANRHIDPHTGVVLESALTCLHNMCVGHERNCRRLLKQGLDSLIDLAEGSSFPEVDPASVQGPSYTWDEAMGKADRERAVARRMAELAENQKSNQTLATSLLQILGPYNWVICVNCGKKSFGGSTCVDCGHSVAFG